MQLLCRSPLHQSEFLAVGVRRCSESTISRQSPPRVLRVYAGDNKRQPNSIDIGAASRGGWDEVKVVRTTPLPEPKRAKSFAKKAAAPPRTPAVIISAKPIIRSDSKQLDFGAPIDQRFNVEFMNEFHIELCQISRCCFRSYMLSENSLGSLEPMLFPIPWNHPLRIGRSKRSLS